MGSKFDLVQLPVDAVTGFGTRDSMVAALIRAVDPDADPSVLAIFSLDGSGEFREELGEEVSNEVIARLAQEFGRFVQPDGECFAPRRHEFAALFTIPFARVETILAAAAIAMRREGSIFSIQTTFGVAHLPREAASPVAALIVADQRRVQAQKLRR